MSGSLPIGADQTPSTDRASVGGAMALAAKARYPDQIEHDATVPNEAIAALRADPARMLYPDRVHLNPIALRELALITTPLGTEALARPADNRAGSGIRGHRRIARQHPYVERPNRCPQGERGNRRGARGA